VKNVLKGKFVVGSIPTAPAIRQRRLHDGVEEAGDGKLELWGGWSIQPDKELTAGACDGFLDLVYFRNLRRRMENMAVWLMNWLAKILREPDGGNPGRPGDNRPGGGRETKEVIDGVILVDHRTCNTAGPRTRILREPSTGT